MEHERRHRPHRDGSGYGRGVHCAARPHHHRGPVRFGHCCDPVPALVGLAEHPARRSAHCRPCRDVRHAGHDRRVLGDFGRGRADVRRDRSGSGGLGGLGGLGGRQTDVLSAARDAPRCWRAGWPGGRRHGHTDRRCPSEGVRPPDQRRRAASRAPSEARIAAQDGTLRAVHFAARAAPLEILRAAPVGLVGPTGPTGPTGPRWTGPQERRRPLGDEGADRDAVAGPRRVRRPRAAVARHPSARAPTVHRDTDCRPHRNRGTARHWYGCGE